MAFGLGLLAASLIPASRKEQDLVRQAKDSDALQQVTEGAKAVGKEMADDLREPAQQAAQEVKETAQAGAENVKDTAKAGRRRSGGRPSRRAPTSPTRPRTPAARSRAADRPAEQPHSASRAPDLGRGPAAALGHNRRMTDPHPLAAHGHWQDVARATGLLGADGTVASTIFAEMSALAERTGAINLGQGFPTPPARRTCARPPWPPSTPGTTSTRRARASPPCGPRSPPTSAGTTASRSTRRPRSWSPPAPPRRSPPASSPSPGRATRSSPWSPSTTPTPRSSPSPGRPTGPSRCARARAASAWTPPTSTPPSGRGPACCWSTARTTPPASSSPPTSLGLLGRAAAAADAVVLTDEVYEHLTYGPRHVPMATLPGLAGRTLTVSSAGKTLAVTGWKVGWVHGPAALVTAVRTVKQFLTYVASGPFQHAVAAALDDADGATARYVADQAAALAGRRDVLLAGLRAGGFVPVAPEGTYFVVADGAPLGYPDAVDLCRGCPDGPAWWPSRSRRSARRAARWRARWRPGCASPTSSPSPWWPRRPGGWRRWATEPGSRRGCPPAGAPIRAGRALPLPRIDSPPAARDT